MDLIYLVEILSHFTQYLKDNDKRALANTCSTFKAKIPYKIYIKLTQKNYTHVNLNEIAKLSLSVPICLDLSHNQEVTSLDDFTHLHSLNLSHCRRVLDVSKLGNIKHLNLAFCDNIKGLESITSDGLILPYTPPHLTQQERLNLDQAKIGVRQEGTYRGIKWSINRVYGPFIFLCGYLHDLDLDNETTDAIEYYSHCELTALNGFDCAHHLDYTCNRFQTNNNGIYRCSTYVREKLYAMIDCIIEPDKY